ncbi:endonuclease III-like protein 1 [Galendromus occidentalis]|uniref:Endonuclease III homolog n=1 Tax=Galendromus occidentalis TaxID=34638 RepID=A0AAJ6QUX6_9ACAR|nr:endonuclease III-like protein 1 [Galendromus occidentalis]
MLQVPKSHFLKSIRGIMPRTRAASQKQAVPAPDAPGTPAEHTSKPKKTVRRKKSDEVKVPVSSADGEISDIEDVVSKKLKWEPKNWFQILEGVRKMREKKDAPCDIMGCHMVSGEKADPKLQRFQILISLLLSSQTRDEVNYAACSRLHDFGFTPEKLKETDEAIIEKMLHPVGFYRTKAKNLRKVAQICFERYDSDIPHSVEELCQLPGVGPKMAYLTMNCAWKETTGIGVDTHVHRLAQRWLWLPKGQTKSPEDTRLQLESWLPSDLWEELNWLLVGFGQTVCGPTHPKCSECLINDVCPNAFKENKKKASPEGKKKASPEGKKKASPQGKKKQEKSP